MEPFLKYISKKKRKRSAIYGYQPTAMTSDYVPFRTQVSEENGLKHDGPKNRQSVHQIVLPDDDDSSSIGENFEVASITSSIEDQLTLVMFILLFLVVIHCHAHNYLHLFILSYLFLSLLQMEG